jgi:putative peptide zinc metalloprotease protein
MAATFLSDNWFRVAALRPRLRPHARVSRQRFRGKPWYIVHDPLTNRSHRFSPTAWWLANQLDGVSTVDHAWQLALAQLGDAAPSQEEVIRLLSQLHGADLLLSEATPESTELLERRGKQMKPKWLSGLLNPMSVRVPLWDPDLFLSRTLRWLQPWFGRAGAALWLLLVLPALALAAQHWTELSSNLADRLLAAGNLAAIALVFPFVKLLHELGHGYAVKAYGGEVHEAGVMLLVFAPAPYVDASASSGFRSKWVRAMVAAAGMLTELALAALAMYVWLSVEPGAVRSIAFNVMTVAGISTLVFNANPLLRYDGYYILCDLIEIPNLAQRANTYWGWLVQHHLFGERDAAPPETGAAERRWLFAYAPAAFVYRAVVSLSIALFIANQYFFVGVLLALWSVAGLIVAPAMRSLRFLLASPALARQRPRALALSAAALLGAVLLAVLVPLPSSSTVQAVVWVPAGAEVHAASNGFVRAVHVRAMAPVRPGQTLFDLDDSALLARYREQSARVNELDVQAVREQAEDRARAFQTREALAREQLQLDDLATRVAQLATLAQAEGSFVRAGSEDLPGSYVKRGDLLGYILAPGQRTIRAVVPQDEIGMVRGALRSIEVQLADRIGSRYTGQIVRTVPLGAENLPSKALTVEGGGDFVLDPRDPAALRTLDKVFQFDIAISPVPSDLRIGTRAYVRFEYAPEPLAVQLGRRLRQLLLSRLHV